MPSDNDMAETPDESQRATMARLRRMFTDGGVAGYHSSSGAGVRCPFCSTEDDSSYIHIDRRINFLGNDAYDASGHYGMQVRGSVTAIEFESETCVHRWALAFGFHKGATFVRVVRLADRTADSEE